MAKFNDNYMQIKDIYSRQASELMQLNTAVLFLVFNRFDTSKEVFMSIRAIQPLKLYIASDGARSNVSGEKEKVEEIRKYIIDNIDWKCEIKTQFRENNLGTKYGVNNAISWFFDQEEYGIILEDDCLPSTSFFKFCEELLVKYNDNKDIWHISGNNFQDGIKYSKESYYFSIHNHSWGWATWADRWKQYNVEITSLEHFDQEKIIDNLNLTPEIKNFYAKIFKETLDKKSNTWDYQWTYTIWLNKGICIIPSKNLITNIGFGSEATHTFDVTSKFANVKRHEIKFPLKHPDLIIVNKQADIYTCKKLINQRSLTKKVIRKIYNFLTK